VVSTDDGVSPADSPSQANNDSPDSEEAGPVSEDKGSDEEYKEEI
jgi:hypothetical protein